MKILHIVTHLGGGVGTVLLNWAEKDKQNKHSFVCLGYNFSSTIDRCNKNNIILQNNTTNEETCLAIKNNKPDIVLLHYWNHPLLVHLIITTTLPPCRLVVYNHISGKSAPYIIPEKIYSYADRVIHSSYASLGANLFNTIMSTGGVDRFVDVTLEPHEEFNIAYIGTLDFSKLRKDFIKICKGIADRIEDAKFMVCGTGDAETEIKNQAIALGIESKFTFNGLVPDITPYLKRADIFLYPLDENHYGTGEQVLGEAMACGVPPVVMKNRCEEEIVADGISGLIAYDRTSCIENVVNLRHDPVLRRRLSLAAKKSAEQKYSLTLFVEKWNLVFQETEKIAPKEKTWERPRIEEITQYVSGTETLIQSLGDKGALLSRYIEIDRELREFLSSKQWNSTSKGSVNQYLKHFPNDCYLNIFKKIIEGA